MAGGGRTIGDYQLQHSIATSQFAQLWEVTKPGVASRYAMKLLLPDALRDHQQVTGLKNEAKVTKSLDHPHVIKFHGLEITPKYAYLLLELFRAPNVKTLMAQNLADVQRRIRELIEPACLALHHMHERRWVHKDVKPDNLLFNEASDVRLIDFSVSSRMVTGVARLFARSNKLIQGTRTYIAPETILRERLTPRTDVYSFGIMLFEIVTGRPPFLASSPDELLRKHLGDRPPAPSEFNSNVTPEMDRLVSRMLAKAPEKRPGSMQEVHGLFRNLTVFKEPIPPPSDEGSRPNAEAARLVEAGGDSEDSSAASREPVSKTTTARKTVRRTPSVPGAGNRSESEPDGDAD